MPALDIFESNVKDLDELKLRNVAASAARRYSIVNQTLPAIFGRRHGLSADGDARTDAGHHEYGRKFMTGANAPARGEVAANVRKGCGHVAQPSRMAAGIGRCRQPAVVENRHVMLRTFPDLIAGIRLCPLPSRAACHTARIRQVHVTLPADRSGSAVMLPVVRRSNVGIIGSVGRSCLDGTRRSSTDPWDRPL